MPAKIFGGLDEGAQRPVVHERYHRAFSAAQIEAVVPIGAQALANAGVSHLCRGEIEGAFQVLVDRGLALVGKGQQLVEERIVAGLFHIFANRNDDPQSVVGTGVLDAVNQGFAVRRVRDGGRLEGRRILLFGIEPVGIEEVQCVPLAHLRFQQFDDALPALFRIGVDHAHHVLRGVAEA